MLITGMILLALIIYYFPKSIFFSQTGNTLNKAFLDRLGFSDIVVIISLIQLFFLIFFAFLLRSRRQKLLLVSVILNSVILCSIALPFTFISQVRTSTVNAYIETFPKGFPLPGLNESAGTAEYSDSSSVHPLGYANFYNKKNPHTGSCDFPHYNAWLSLIPGKSFIAQRISWPAFCLFRTIRWKLDYNNRIYL